ncbi:MAG: redoxin domain-containing protein [Planctomycetes bacterium]|nr:redoxin domain-containing protein [Planctomycetota bacterium]
MQDAARDAIPKPAPKAPTELEGEFKALEKEFRDARRAYQLALKAKYEERQKLGQQLTAEDRAGDPTPQYVPRFREFATRAKGTEWGGRALLNAIDMSVAKVEPAWLDELIEVYANDATIGGRAAEVIGNLSWRAGSEVSEAALRRLIATTTRDTVSAAANFNLGTALMQGVYVPGQGPAADNTPERVAEAAKLLRLVAEKFPDTTYAERAKGALFELENLSIGKVAPDFETVDENGKPWKLSDYRGKVTIIDFWGYW